MQSQGQDLSVLSLCPPPTQHLVPLSWDSLPNKMIRNSVIKWVLLGKKKSPPLLDAFACEGRWPFQVHKNTKDKFYTHLWLSVSEGTAGINQGMRQRLERNLTAFIK